MRKKAPKKTKEEKLAENFFPVNRHDVKYAIEKEQKKIEESIQTIEEEKPKRKKTIKRKVSKKFSGRIKKDYKIPNIKLKKNGYELIITEKPQAAMKISSALGNDEKKNLHGVPYYEIEKNGKKIIVACAVGHLFTLKQKKSGSEFPIFDINWVPNFMARKNDFTKRYYDTLLSLAKNAGSLTVATDFDIEGEVIGLNIVRFICNQKDANRMKFSTLTDKELNDSYESKTKSLNWGQAIAGETRHYLDWFYGINFSRALMNAIKTTGKFKIMSIGRVQGPTLNLIVQKEREIQAFESKPYWQVFIEIDDNKNKTELKHNKDIFNKSEIEKFKNLKGKTANTKTKKTRQTIPPNHPFNLTTLQTEAYKFYGITPSVTLRIAQSLYLSGLISYPRTSSQKLPESINYKEILKVLSEKYKVGRLITRKKPIEGRKTDPAHPSIYPTGNFQILSGGDEKIYELIVKRFLSLFCDDAIIDNKKISATVDDLIFNARGTEIRKKAWMEIYPVKLKENEIPDFNGKAKILNVKIDEKETQPPRRYSPASIVAELEKRNLGTKATRANILETLYDRNYIKEKSIDATPLGISLIETFEKFSPIIIDEELTKNFENEMEKIQKSKKDFEEMELKVLEKAKKTIKKIAEQFKKNENEIGKELLDANIKLQEKQKEENKLNLCPVCKKGNLAVTYSRKTKRHFIACNAYPDCKTTYSLPPNGVIKKTDKVCESCGFPTLMLLKRGRKPWFFCFNTECEKNKERLEKYRKKIEEENN